MPPLHKCFMGTNEFIQIVITSLDLLQILFFWNLVGVPSLARIWLSFPRKETWPLEVDSIRRVDALSCLRMECLLHFATEVLVRMWLGPALSSKFILMGTRLDLTSPLDQMIIFFSCHPKYSKNYMTTLYYHAKALGFYKNLLTRRYCGL